MTPGSRVVAGFVISPLASGVMHAAWAGSWRAGVAALLVAWLAALLAGVPAWRLFSRRGWLRLWHAALAGTVIGVVAAAVVLTSIGLANARVVSGTLASYFLVLFAAHGLMVACLYWLIAVRNRAPRQGPSPG